MAQVHEQMFYDLVDEELRSGVRDAGIWVKAREVYGERAEKTEKVYVEMRVAQIARDTRRVKVVAQHRRKAYGFNQAMFLTGWLPPIGSWYLLNRDVSWSKALLVLVVSVAAIMVIAGGMMAVPEYKTGIAIAGLIGWIVAWFFCAKQTNRWIAEGIEPLKSMLRSVKPADVLAFEKGEQMIVTTPDKLERNFAS